MENVTYFDASFFLLDNSFENRRHGEGKGEDHKEIQHAQQDGKIHLDTQIKENGIIIKNEFFSQLNKSKRRIHVGHTMGVTLG